MYRELDRGTIYVNNHMKKLGNTVTVTHTCTHPYTCNYITEAALSAPITIATLSIITPTTNNNTNIRVECREGVYDYSI